MNSRNLLPGRSRPADRLSKRDRDAWERAVAEAAPTQAPTKPAQAKTAPAGNTTRPANIGKDGQVRQNQLKFHWTTECPACGFKVAVAATLSQSSAWPGAAAAISISS